MKICFCSMLFQNQEEVIKKTKKGFIQVQNHKYIKSVIEGMEQVLDEPIFLLNTLDVASYPRYSDVFLKSNRWSHDGKNDDYEVGKINLPGIKYIMEYIGLYRKLNEWIKKNKNEELRIIAYGRRLSHILSILHIKRKYPKVKTCMILADLSGKYACATIGMTGEKSYSLKEKIAAYLLEKQVEWSKKFDSFILLTVDMAKVLEIKKDYVVVEGIHADRGYITQKKENEKIKILYVGALEKQYGIGILIEAFKKITGDNYELQLVGRGSYESEIQRAMSEDQRIKLIDFQPLDMVLDMERKADILINPRQNIGLYTKYSFPSKTMEYLASGTPVIAYKLDGIPSEYDSYLQYVENNSVESLTSKILEISSMSFEQRKILGNQGRNFILEEKTPFIQGKKIVDLLERI